MEGQEILSELQKLLQQNGVATAANELKVTLPVKAKVMSPDDPGGDREFFIRKPTVKSSRAFYMAKAKYQGTLETATDLGKYMAQVKAEKKQLLAADGKPDKKRLAELEKEIALTDKQTEQNDESFYEAENVLAYCSIDTQLGFEQIDWEEADRREVHGAAHFFEDSLIASTARPRS